GKGEDGRLDGLDHRLPGRARGERAAEPVQPRVEVREQKVVLGVEVTVERPHRDTGVRGDLFRRRLLDPVREEPDECRPAQGVAGPLAPHGSRGSGHVPTVTHGCGWRTLYG